MKIVIDARAASHPQPGGFKTYTRGLIRGLSHTDEDYRCLLLADRYVDEDWWPSDARFETRILYGRLPLLGAGFREQFALPRLLSHEHYDVVHFLCNTGPLLMPGNSVVTIHDLAPILYPARWPKGFNLAHWRRFLTRFYAQMILPSLAQKATAIITDSEASKRDLIGCLQVPMEKVSVIPLGYDECFKQRSVVRRNESHTLGQGCNAGEFVLTLGSLNRRKNVAAVIEAFASIPQKLKEQYPLVVILTDNDSQVLLSDLVTQAGCQAYVHLVPGPKSAEGLAGWYGSARVFVVCSLYEGFGLPALEAMACGAPVVSSSVSSLPEVVGDAAILVDPKDPLAISVAIKSVLENEALYTDLRTRGLRRAMFFSWERTARETLAVYDHVCRHSRDLYTLEDM
ncbi:MAG: glycosyltransferase family 4 protein [Anaerolineae bacterium]|nr:glycosyltransferase family 4 protein [Anaerolineae bacterium]